MSKFKVGDYVETRHDYCPTCLSIEGVVIEVIEIGEKTLYKVEWDRDWTYDDEEIQLMQEYNGN